MKIYHLSFDESALWKLDLRMAAQKTVSSSSIYV